MRFLKATRAAITSFCTSLPQPEDAAVNNDVVMPQDWREFSGSNLFRTVPVRMTLVTAVVWFACGCQLQEQPQSVRVPAVVTRFTNDPLAAAPGCPPIMPAMAGLPNLKVGLTMQSFNDPVHVPFAAQLGTILIRELQLSKGSMQVQPVTLNPHAAVSETSDENSCIDSCGRDFCQLSGRHRHTAARSSTSSTGGLSRAAFGRSDSCRSYYRIPWLLPYTQRLRSKFLMVPQKSQFMPQQQAGTPLNTDWSNLAHHERSDIAGLVKRNRPTRHLATTVLMH